ncbi:hypothetical protein GOP47_0030199 [Adiantum capillus-veneris]|nr:hypothetical protein GOP47_0030199 [Adiantum capillus-veneris]
MDLFSVSFLALALMLPASSSGDVIKGAYHYYDSGVDPAGINAMPFTHLYYAFAKLDPSTYSVLPPDSDNGRIAAFTPAVRQSNPDVQTMLSIGGGGSSSSSTIFSSMAASSTARANFIRTSIALARQYSFDGLDLDWEYPSTAADMANFGTLIQEWQAAVVAENAADPLLLAAAVYFTCDYYTGNTYPVASISDNLDWVNIMAYDFWEWQPNKTGIHTALYKSDDTEPMVSTDGGVSAWLSAGLPPQKTMLGLASYGRTWYLESPATSNGIGAAATGAGPVYSYDMVQSFIQSSSATCRRDSTVSVGVYCYGLVGSSQTLWVGYDDATSISAKVNYLKGRQMGGYFFWRLGFDGNGVLAAQASATMG